MSFGLKVWDENGVETLDTADLVTRKLGQVSTTINQAGSVTVPGTGVIWFSLQPNYHPGLYAVSAPPLVTMSERVISWTAAAQAVVIQYGVY